MEIRLLQDIHCFKGQVLKGEVNRLASFLIKHSPKTASAEWAKHTTCRGKFEDPHMVLSQTISDIQL
jgi:hypothetical protein